MITNRWSQGCARYRGICWIDWILRGYSQVMLQNNPMSGLLFLIAVFVSAYHENIPEVAWGCLLSTVVATLCAALLVKDKEALSNGTLGFNGCLVGAALPTFLAPSPWLWLCIVFSALISVIMSLALNQILKTWAITALTAPFVLTTWTALLASYTFFRFESAHLPIPTLMSGSHSIDKPFTFPDIVSGTLDGVSQVFLGSSMISGLIILLGLAVSSFWAMGLAFFGALTAVIIAGLAGANLIQIDQGMYAFSAVLTAIALGSTFNSPGVKTLCYTLIGVIFTVLLQGAFNALLAPLGIPSLTMPFVIASWLFLIVNQQIFPTQSSTL